MFLNVFLLRHAPHKPHVEKNILSTHYGVYVYTCFKMYSYLCCCKSRKSNEYNDILDLASNSNVLLAYDTFSTAQWT